MDKADESVTSAASLHDVKAMPASDVTSLVTLFSTMLTQAKGEILAAMATNSENAAARWTTHEREVAKDVERLARVEMLLQQHLDEQVLDDAVMSARIAPVKTTAQWVGAHWKDLVILLVGVAAAFNTVFSDAIGRLGN